MGQVSPTIQQGGLRIALFCFSALFFFSSLLLLSGCSSTQESQNAMILAFGDSLTFGTGAPPQHAYPARLAQALNTEVINAGIPGETSAEARQRLSQLLTHYQPQQVILCSGANDFIQGKSLNALKENLRVMIERMQQQQIEVILIAVPHYGVSVQPPPLYRQLAEHYQLRLDNTILSELVSTPELLSDMVHPNSAGYQKMAEAIQQLLQRPLVQ